MVIGAILIAGSVIEGVIQQLAIAMGSSSLTSVTDEWNLNIWSMVGNFLWMLSYVLNKEIPIVVIVGATIALRYLHRFLRLISACRLTRFLPWTAIRHIMEEYLNDDLVVLSIGMISMAFLHILGPFSDNMIKQVSIGIVYLGRHHIPILIFLVIAVLISL